MNNSSQASVDVHQRIKTAIKEIEKESSFLCHNIETIAEKANTDTRTAKNHLASKTIHISPFFILGNAVQFFALLAIIILALVFLAKRRRHK